MLRALTELLDNVSADSPVIVVLDDVHNADVSSWQVLYHMARRLPDRPVLVLATARTADLARHPATATDPRTKTARHPLRMRLDRSQTLPVFSCETNP